MGMRSPTVLHYWFPAYDVSYAKYSPGSLLLLDISRSAAALGLREIELGHGQEAYKVAATDRAIPIASGFMVGSASLRSRSSTSPRWDRSTIKNLAARSVPAFGWRNFLSRLARGVP